MRQLFLAVAAAILAALLAGPAHAAYSSGRSSSGGGARGSYSSGSHSYRSGGGSSSSHTYSSPSSASSGRGFGSGISQALRHEASGTAWTASRTRPSGSAPAPSFPASKPPAPMSPPAPFPRTSAPYPQTYAPFPQTSAPFPPTPARSPAPFPQGGGSTVIVPVPIPVPYPARRYSTYGYAGGYSRPSPAYGSTGTPGWDGSPAAAPPAESPQAASESSAVPPRRSHVGMMLLCLLLVAGMAAVLVWTLWSARAASRQGQPPSAPAAGLFNPLGLKPGLYFSLDLSDYDGLQFRIEEIKDYTVKLAGETFRFAAYCGISHEPGKEPVRVQVRVENRPKVGPESPDLLNAVALHTMDEFGFTQEFYQVVTDGTGLFQVTDDATGAVKAEYRRPTEVTASIPATVASLKDAGEAGKAEPSQAKISQIEYWDYKRELEGGGTEFLFVELDKKDGWFRILVGPEIDIARVKA